jgi:two-component system response regulator (stage 0 sporulation protein A)
MKPARILLVDESWEVRHAIERQMREMAEGLCLEIMEDGAAALRRIQREPIDGLITDLAVPGLPGMGGFLLIEAFQARSHEGKAGVILLTALLSEALMNRAMALEVDYYMLKPFDPEAVCHRAADLSGCLPGPAQKTIAQKRVLPSLDERITETLLDSGIPAHIKGYYFLREAIKIILADPDILHAITKELYPAVARRFDTSPLRVERAIGHAISVGWSKGRMEKSHGKPPNGKFMAWMAQNFSRPKSA